MKIEASQNVKDTLNKLVSSFESTIGPNLVGIYLHGSLAMGVFNPISSDIDILVVVKGKLAPDTKLALWSQLQLLSPNAPAKGFELSIVTLDVLKNFEHPTPYEFHYSYGMEGSQIEDSGAHDPDLAAHFVITKARGVCLYGEPIENIFPDVPKTYYLQSIAHDAEWSFNNVQKGADSGTCPVPTYAVLNFCRILAFIQDGLIASKKEGGEWALDQLPGDYAPLIQEALKEYAQSGASQPVDALLLKQFSTYAWDIIKTVKS